MWEGTNEKAVWGLMQFIIIPFLTNLLLPWFYTIQILIQLGWMSIFCWKNQLKMLNSKQNKDPPFFVWRQSVLNMVFILLFSLSPSLLSAMFSIHSENILRCGFTQLSDMCLRQSIKSNLQIIAYRVFSDKNVLMLYLTFWI